MLSRAAHVVWTVWRDAGIQVQDVPWIQVVFNRVCMNGEPAIQRVKQDRRGTGVLPQGGASAEPENNDPDPGSLQDLARTHRDRAFAAG